MPHIIEILRTLIGEYIPMTTTHYILMPDGTIEEKVIAIGGIGAWNLEYIFACFLVLLAIYAIYMSFKWTFYVLKKSNRKGGI